MFFKRKHRRKLLTEAVNACDEWGLELDGVNTNDPIKQKEYGYDSRKIGSCIYIDDKIVGCNPWSPDFINALIEDISDAYLDDQSITYAVDFDGTLCQEVYPEIGTPNRSLINTLNYARMRGHSVVLWTCRQDPDGFYEWPKAVSVALLALTKYLIGFPFRVVFYGILFFAAIFGTSAIINPVLDYIGVHGKREA